MEDEKSKKRILIIDNKTDGAEPRFSNMWADNDNFYIEIRDITIAIKKKTISEILNNQVNNC